MAGSRYIVAVALFLLAGCEGEDRAIRSVAWTPEGVAFIRSSRLFLWRPERGRRPLGLGETALKEDRFALSPDSRRIAVVPEGEAVWNIWEIDLPAGTARRITDSIYKDFFPVYAPSGDAVFFISYREGRADIWRVRLDDMSLKRLTDDEAEETQIAVSTDGARLLYTVASDDGTSSLHALDLAAGESRKVADGLSAVTSLAFSPGGDRYSFCSGGGLWLGRGSGEPSRMAEADSAAWVPGGRTLYFCREGDVWRYDLSGLFAGERRLTRNVGIDSLPSPSPDGRRLAYATGPGGVPELLTVVSSSFSPSTRIWCPTSPASINDYYAANGMEGEASRYFSSIIGRSEDKADIAHLMASDLLKEKKYRKAIDVLRENTRDGYGIGRIYMYYLRDFAAALEYFKEEEKAKDELMLIYACRPGLLKKYCGGWVEVERGHYEKGMRVIDDFLARVGKLKALGPVYYLRAGVYDRDLHDEKKAIAAYGEALSAWPESPDALSARMRLGQLCEAAGELDEAVAAYRSAAATAGEERAAEKARAYASILRITVEGGGDIEPLLAEIGADGGPYRAEFVDEAQRILDERGGFVETNGIIRTALFDWGLEPGDISEALSSSCAAVDPDDLVHVRPEGLPAWFKERIIIAASRVDEKFAAPVREFLERPTSVQAGKMLASLGDYRGGLEPLVDDYVLGNLSLNEGKTAEAISRFKRLCGCEEGYYYQQLACCGRTEGEEAGEWLKLERENDCAFWGEARNLAEILSGRRGLFSGADDSGPAPGFEDGYRAFMSKYPRSTLLPACAARIASAMPEQGKRKELLAILREYREGCVALPFFLLISDYVKSGNYGLALAVGEPLARTTDDPSIKIAAADLLSEVGGESESLPFLWDISINCTDSPEWGTAQERLISKLVSSEKYESALLMLDELVEKRPSSEFALSGEARALRVELLAKLGRLREASTEAEKIVAAGGPSLRWLPGSMPEELAAFMFAERRGALMSLYSSLGEEERERLEEMVPELKREKIKTKQ